MPAPKSVRDTIIAEALGEGPEGMRLVASVILNRALARDLTPEQVVNQSGQFEGRYSPGSSVKAAMDDPAVIARVDALWDSIETGGVPDKYSGADFFHTPSVSPRWAGSMDQLGQVGNHVYYASGAVPAGGYGGTGEERQAPAPAIMSALLAGTRDAPAAEQSQVAAYTTPFTKNGQEYQPETFEVQWGDYREGVRPEVVSVLDAAQQQLDFPLVIRSGYRSPERNAAVGGAKRSQHLGGMAVDVSMEGLEAAQRRQLVDALADAGAPRIGAYSGNTGLHVDLASGYKPPEGMRFYPMMDGSYGNFDIAPSYLRDGAYGSPVSAPRIAPTPAIMSAQMQQRRQSGGVDAGTRIAAALMGNGGYQPPTPAIMSEALQLQRAGFQLPDMNRTTMDLGQRVGMGDIGSMRGGGQQPQRQQVQSGLQGALQRLRQRFSGANAGDSLALSPGPDASGVMFDTGYDQGTQSVRKFANPGPSQGVIDSVGAASPFRNVNMGWGSVFDPVRGGNPIPQTRGPLFGQPGPSRMDPPGYSPNMGQIDAVRQGGIRPSPQMQRWGTQMPQGERPAVVDSLLAGINESRPWGQQAITRARDQRAQALLAGGGGLAGGGIAPVPTVPQWITTTKMVPKQVPVNLGATLDDTKGAVLHSGSRDTVAQAQAGRDAVARMKTIMVPQQVRTQNPEWQAPTRGGLGLPSGGQGGQVVKGKDGKSYMYVQTGGGVGSPTSWGWSEYNPNAGQSQGFGMGQYLDIARALMSGPQKQPAVAPQRNPIVQALTNWRGTAPTVTQGQQPGGVFVQTHGGGNDGGGATLSGASPSGTMSDVTAAIYRANKEAIGGVITQQSIDRALRDGTQLYSRW